MRAAYSLAKHRRPSRRFDINQRKIAAELVEIRGDKNFRDVIERLVHALRMTSGE